MTELLDTSPAAARRELDQALDRIAADAGGRDDEPHPDFPEDAIGRLERAGALASNVFPGPQRPPAAEELGLVRRVAQADGSVGRIFEGHLNAVERIAVQAPPQLRDSELRAVAAGQLRAGVWGGDPVAGEGEPATVIPRGREYVLRGCKTFCSGAGGLHRALVLARGEHGGPPISAWVDLTDPWRILIDETWYRSHGLRASVSHRVVFQDAPVIALVGAPGSIAQQPWFARDALRTAASWAGMLDTAAEAALRELAVRPQSGPLEGLATGRMLTAQRTVSLWIDAAARAMDGADESLPDVALHARAAISDASRTLLDEAARACGSRPFARAGALDRARRDLEVFLLQHRLDPLLAHAGEAAIREGAS